MATATKRRELTVEDIEAGMDNDEWLGFGYLGERSRERRAAQDRGDAMVLAEANRRGWTPERLFTWLNSRDGRHFGDLAFGGWDDVELAKHGPRMFEGY